MAITVSDLQAEITSHSYNILTDGDDANAQRALDRARIWLLARLTEEKDETEEVVVNEDDQVIRQIILKYALYELYTFGEQESVAKDKKDDALELIGSYISRRAGSATIDSASTSPAASIAMRERKKSP